MQGCYDHVSFSALWTRKKVLTSWYCDDGSSWCVAHLILHTEIYTYRSGAKSRLLCWWYERDYFQIFVLIRWIGLISAGPESFSLLLPRHLPRFFFCSHFLMELTSKQKTFFCLCTHTFWARKFNNKQPQKHALFSLASERASKSTGPKSFARLKRCASAWADIKEFQQGKFTSLSEECKKINGRRKLVYSWSKTQDGAGCNEIGI